MNQPQARNVKHLPYEIDERNRFQFYENYWKRVGLELLAKHFSASPDKTVLDYGCGRGETLQIFGGAGFQTVGADIDPECVRLAARFGKSVILDPEDPVAQFGKKSYDAVTCFHVLEHVDFPKKTLGELGQIARSYVVLAVPNLRNLHGIFRRTINLQDINEGHLQSWDHGHFLNLAERHCGLKLVEWGYDATILSGLSNFSQRLLGTRATIFLETGIFKRIFPWHGISVLGLFRPV
jgi:SAM-dependent methyltransferase